MNAPYQLARPTRLKTFDPSNVISFALFLMLPAILPFIRRAGPPILVATGLFAAIMLWRQARLGRVLRSQLQQPATMFFIAFLAWATISLAWSPWPTRGVTTILTSLLLVASMVMIAAFPLARNAPRFLALGLACGCGVIALDLLIGGKVLRLAYERPDEFRYNMVVVTYAVLAAALLAHQETLKLLRLLLVGAVLMAAAFLSQSETAKLAVLMIPLAYMGAWMLPAATRRPIILSILAFVWVFAAFGMQHLVLLKSILPGDFWSAGSSEERLKVWYAFTQFAIQGLPLGWGLESAAAPQKTVFFASASAELQAGLQNWHSHDNVLQIAVELGLPGLLLSFLTAAPIISNALTKRAGRNSALLSLVAVVLVIGCISHGLWQSWWWAAVLIGWYFSTSHHADQDEGRALNAELRGERFTELVSSELFQAGLVVCSAAVLSKLVRVAYVGHAESAIIWSMSLTFAFCAVYIGARFMKFILNSSTPAAFGYVIPVLSLSFLLMAGTILLARFDYHRLEFVLSFVLAIPIVTWACHHEERRRSWRFHVFSDADLEGYAQFPIVTLKKIDLTDTISDKRSDGIIVDFTQVLSPEQKRYLASCALNGVKALDKIEIVALLEGAIPAEHVAQIARTTAQDLGFYHAIKRVIDLVAAIVLAPLFLLVIAACALAIKWDDGGRVFFRQQRVGHKGKLFRVWKLRTMTDMVNVEAVRHFTIKGDDRITRVGRFLRRTRLDEFPQIFNILLGEMSWIGPRPESAPLAKWYASEIDLYHFRHIVRPGITGWAAVKQGNVAEVEAARQKLFYDFFYIKNYSFQLDILIAMKTVKIMISGFGAK